MSTAFALLCCGTFAATAFADFLETHAPLPLRVLDVSNNYIDTDGLTTLVDVLTDQAKCPSFAYLVCLINPCAGVNSRDYFKGLTPSILGKIIWFQMSSMIAREWVRMLGWSLCRDSRKAETIVDENLRYWFNETYAIGGVSDLGSIDAVIDSVFGREVVPVQQTLIDALAVDLSSSQNVLRSIVDMVCRRGSSRVPSLFAVEAGFRYVSGATVQAGNNDNDSAMKAVKKTNTEDCFSATKAAKKKNAEDWFDATKAAKKNAEDWFDAASTVDTVFLRQLRPELRSWLTDESENVSDASETVSATAPPSRAPCSCLRSIGPVHLVG